MLGLLDQYARPAAAQVRELIDVQIERLDGRPIHHSEVAVTTVPTVADQRAREARYAERHQHMSWDPAHKRVTDSDDREATVGLGLEEIGKVAGVDRDRSDPKTDFTSVGPDGRTVTWDVKSFRSLENVPANDLWRAYTDARATSAIQGKLDNVRMW